MKNHENSTFYEDKQKFKEVRRRLEEPGNTPIIFKKIDVIPPINIRDKKINENIKKTQSPNTENDASNSKKLTPNGKLKVALDLVSNITTYPTNITSIISGDAYVITEKLLDIISETIAQISNTPNLKKDSHINSKMGQVRQKTEDLIRLVHNSAKLLKDTNDVVYSILNKMDKVCREAVLNNPTLFGIVEDILMKFCEVQDLLDFDQEEKTIEILFEMSKMIYIYKNKVCELVKDDYKVDDEYKKREFGFYYDNKIKQNKTFVDKMNEEAYTDWSSWIETFIEDKDVKCMDSVDNLDKAASVNLISNVDKEVVNLDTVDSVPLLDNITDLMIDNVPSSIDSPNLNIDKSDILNTVSNHKIYSILAMEVTLRLKKIPFAMMRPKKSFKKIGEATFSEVFKSSSHVYKIIPLGNKDNYTPYDVFIGEVFIQHTLRKEKGICYLIRACLAQGKYPKAFLEAWDDYGKVENDRPSKYKKDQVFGVLFMKEGCTPLDKISFDNFNLSWFVKTLVGILANLEDNYEFEHRDLHAGNILIGPRSIILIDFTLSRIKKCGKVVYNDLSKYKWLFEGDASVDEQFEIYRKMRNACDGDWVSFNPHSNFYWVDYLTRKCKKEIEKLRELKKEEIDILEFVKNTKTVKELHELILSKKEG